MWIENMLTYRNTNKLTADLDRGKMEGRWGPSKDTVARSALKNLLSTNPEVVNVSIDQCYSKHAGLARAYFQVKLAICSLAEQRIIY